MRALNDLTEDELVEESTVAHEHWRTSYALMSGEKNMNGKTPRFFRYQHSTDQWASRMVDIDLEFARRQGHEVQCPYMELLNDA